MKDPGPQGSRDVDPDLRFLLANERTLLAWVRTALALAAAGAALQFVDQFDLHRLIGLGLLILGAASLPVGLSRYRAAERAIRRNTIPRRRNGPELITAGVFMLVLLLAIAALPHV